jgi:hypothetical protein
LNRDWKLLAKFDGEFAKSSEIHAGSVAVRYSWQVTALLGRKRFPSPGRARCAASRQIVGKIRG